MKDLLIKLQACQDAREWTANKTWEEVYNTCDRGDWLLWLFFRTNPDDFQILTLAKGHIANTVRHLMKDERSLKAVDVAIAFGEGKTTRDELDNAAYAAAIVACAYSATDDAAYYAASAAQNSAFAAFAFASTAATATAAAQNSAEKMSLKQSADIVRKYIPIEKWNVNK